MVFFTLYFYIKVYGKLKYVHIFQVLASLLVDLDPPLVLEYHEHDSLLEHRPGRITSHLVNCWQFPLYSNKPIVAAKIAPALYGN